jgi:ABC-type uncharacterized transport system involved in gliding motility auxiliary subunit
MAERTKFEIDQFVMRGGALLLYHDPIRIPEQSIRAMPRRTGLREMLATYGIDVGENLVLDRSNAMAAFSQGYFTLSMPYPFWVKIAPENANEDNPIVNQLSGVVLPWTSTVAAVDSAAMPDSVVVDTLLFTTGFGWTKSGNYDLNPQQRFTDMPKEEGDRLPVAVVASGVFPSQFAGGEVPPVGEADEEGKAPPAADRGVVESSAETRIVVFGSGNMALDDMSGQFPTNVVLLQNAVDWLTLGDELIEIRSRATGDRPIREISERWKSLTKFLVTFGVPILVIFFGLFRYFGLRKRRAATLAASEGAHA